MERIILTRINPIVEQHLPPEQAGFREGKSTTDQVTRLVNDIEESFERKEKFGLLLIDLSAAYDTIWHKGLLYKLLQIIPDIHLVRFIMLLVQDRYFKLETSNGSRSRKRKLRNGLPQGSVLGGKKYDMYSTPLANVTNAHDVPHIAFADDKSAYLSFSLKNDVEIEKLKVKVKEEKNKLESIKEEDDTKELIDSKAFHFLYNHNYYGKEIREKSINDGIRLGSILGKKLKVRGEEKDLIFTRQNSGKINKRLIAELGFDNGNVFSHKFTERYNKANLHISVDGSGSMNGRKWDRAITSTVANPPAGFTAPVCLALIA